MKILVLTSVFPNQKQPGLGVFVRERMFKVAEHCDLKVVAPAPWFPLINLFKKNYRPPIPFQEVQSGIDVFHPRFFNIPRYFKFLDGFFFFLCSLYTLKEIRKTFDFDLIDAHFAYPDGFGAVLLGKFFRKPVTITIRGTIRKYADQSLIRLQISYALAKAAKIFAVCEDLRLATLEFYPCREKSVVIANGIDTKKFYPIDKQYARTSLNLGLERKILISIGGLTERKGFHRLIGILPQLKDRFSDILLIIIGSGSVEGNNESSLRRLVSDINLEDNVLFVGAQSHDQLYRWLNAADVFCLATSNEGWANVFLEAMACGLPVVTTDVGGNREVVCSRDVGTLVPFGDDTEMQKALSEALSQKWDTGKIIKYAQDNNWDKRVVLLRHNFREVIKTS